MSSLYERLGENDIRLLTVTVHDTAISSFKLEIYSREAAPEYDAVSYTWGDDMTAISVPCNETSLEIRTNLSKALPFIHDFRPEPRTRPLWVDGICLNQGDPTEKEIHVPLMNEVYANASRTLIWLGEADENSDLALDNIESLTQKLLTVKNPASLSVQQKLTNHDLPLSDDRKWKAIKLLQLRPWFYRLWTLQEVVLSKETVLLCGNKSTFWNTMSALHQAAIQAGLSFIVEPEADPKARYKYSNTAIRHVDFLRKMRERGIAMTLPNLLLLSVDRGYSVPVDRVWALLGLLNKTYRQYISAAKLVDYETARSRYHESFLGVVKFHIKHDRYMAMQLIENNLRTVRNPLLPSWCPDWHTERGGITLAQHPEALVGIPGGQFYRIEPFMQCNEDSSLELCGLAVDVIECVTASPGEGMLDLKSYPWLAECVGIIMSTPFVPYDVYPASADIPAVPATFPGNVPIHEQRQRYMRAEELVKYVLFPPGTPVDTSARTILKCNGRKFFRTKASRLGIGPADLEENDLLCAMYGARSIWALRPPKSSEDARGQDASESKRHDIEGQEFELLGSAYTPSLFKGEAWVGTSCESMQLFKLR
ncbi:HET-domain-containing protein [Stipitochalara longipes BDJ]|nr:HET-domain-containing protein [Stipitochalara longipes BDJ]